MVSSKLKSFFSLFKFKIGKQPTLGQWRQFFKILNKKERVTFFICLGLFLVSSFYLGLNFYFKNTERRPASGGTYIEGIIGQPRFINPVYARASDTDRDLVELIFSGLMKYDNQGKIIPDLAKDYPEVKEEGRVYEVYLKENLFWPDGSPLKADDVIFTIKTIQNSDYKSPSITSWLGVEVEKISDLGIRFSLKNPYGPFVENLTQKIIPEHIWKDISSQNFPLSIYNLKPIGSGPYKLKGFKQDKQGRIVSLDLVKNPRYFGKTPNLSQISFLFFSKEEDLIKSYQREEIKGFSLTPPISFNNLPEPYLLSLPRYFAVFFNPDKSEILAIQNIRQALNYGSNKEEILEKVLSGYGKVVHSPILPEIYGFSSPSQIYQFNPDLAKEILAKAGFVENKDGVRAKITEKKPSFQLTTDLREGAKGKEVESLQKCLSNPPAGGPEIYPEGEITGLFGKLTKTAVIKFQEKYAQEILEPWGLKKGTGIVSKTTRDKLNELCYPPSKDVLLLKFSLATVNQPVLISLANLLKEQWGKLGIEIEIKTFDISQLEKEVIKQRNYESLLFGEVLTTIPDPFPFWHSAQKKDPGLNLAIYQNKTVDKLLEEARQTSDEKRRREKLEKFQDLLIADSPVVFLYNPDYLYFVSEEIKGVDGKIIADPSKRFSNIDEWYIKTRRVWK